MTRQTLKKIMVEASVLASDFSRLGDQAREAAAAGVDAIQVDIMDGSFVPDITFGPGAPLVVEAGATVLVAGSSVYGGHTSVADNVAALRTSVNRTV